MLLAFLCEVHHLVATSGVEVEYISPVTICEAIERNHYLFTGDLCGPRSWFVLDGTFGFAIHGP